MVPVNRLSLTPRAEALVLECLREGWISSEGPWVERFERGMAAAAGRRHGIAVANGTAALEIAIAALHLAPGDEVILPALTIISCANAVVRAGAVPVAVDCDPLTWTIDPHLAAAAITPRTRAIMPVHLYGMAPDMEAVLALARRTGIRVVEDAAEAHGLSCAGRPCGSFGDLSTFSFYANKHVTTGEGGMVVTDDDALAERCRGLRNLCFGPRRFVHDEIGWNYRLGSLQAALGIAGLEVLPQTVLRKREIGARYRALLADLPGIAMQPEKTRWCEHGCWVFGVVLDDRIPFDAAEAMRRLGERGIGTRPFFWPMHEQPVFRRMGFFANASCPHSERLARRGFYLPSGSGTSDEDIATAAAALRQVLAG